MCTEYTTQLLILQKYPLCTCQRAYHLSAAGCIAWAMPAAGLNSPTAESNGDEEIRTLDLRLAKPPLSQLSYVPEWLSTDDRRLTCCIQRRPPVSPSVLRDPIINRQSSINNLMGPGRLELPTSRLSGVRSSQLSYEPDLQSPPSGALLCPGPAGSIRLNSFFTSLKSNKKCRCSKVISDIAEF